MMCINRISQVFSAMKAALCQYNCKSQIKGLLRAPREMSILRSLHHSW